MSVFLVLLCNVLVFYVGGQHIVIDNNELSAAQVVIVLGAGVSDSGELSGVFKERIDKGLLVYQEGRVSKILVSGDNSSILYNEVIPARQYLIDKGVPEQDIFVDYAGFNTYDTMYRAKAIFQVDSAIVVTQLFHLPRAVLFARVFGIDVQGIPASEHSTTLRNNTREVAARVKAVRDIIMLRKPQYLGKQIPITGDGRDTIEVIK